MPISPGPVVPNIVERPATFEAEAEAYTDWLAGEHRTQLNALEVNVNAKEALAASSASSAVGSASAAAVSAAATAASAAASAASASSALAAPNTSATSSTSITPGPGTVNFVTQAGKAFAVGQSVIVRSSAEPRQFMVGAVTSYAGTALGVDVTAFGQGPIGGASADWVITFWGAVPPAAKSGQVLRLRGATPEWGDEGGEAVSIRASLNLHPHSSNITTVYGGTVENNFASGPDGTMTAARLSGAGAYTYDSVLGISAGDILSYERSYKASPGTIITHEMNPINGSSAGLLINLATGQFTVYLSPAQHFILSASVVPEGDGWWRARLVVLAPAPTGSVACYVTYPANGAVLVDRASLRKSAHPGLYVPTTGAAASGAGARKRNNALYSVSCDVDSGGWNGAHYTRIGRCLSPIGTIDATTYESNSPSFYVGQGVIGLTPGERWNFSIWYRLVPGGSAEPSSVAARLYTDGVGTSVDVIAPLDAQWRRLNVSVVIGAAGDLFTIAPFASVAGVRIAYWMAQSTRGPLPCHPIPTASPTDGQHADLQLRRVHHIDTTHAPVIVAPPADMAPGDWFDVVDVGRAASTNTITVLRGPHRAIDGDESNFEIDVNGWSGRFTFDAEKGLVIS